MRHSGKDARTSELTSLLFLVGRRFRDEAYRCAGTDMPFSILQFEALRYVSERKPLMREVSTYFMVTPSAATLLVGGLVKSGLLARAADRHDRRAVRLVVTPRGRRVLDQAIKEKLKKLEKIFSVLDGTERAALLALLKKMVGENA